MGTTYLAFLVLYLVCLMIRTGYELLKKAGRVRTDKLLFFVVFAAMCLMWASWFSMCPSDPLRFTVPATVRWIGLGAVAVGFGLALGALAQLRGVENIDHLVITGLFSKMRHPMYLGFSLWILGWGIYHGAAVSLAAGLVGIGNISYWRSLEEAKLESRWGEDYRRYRAKTWF